MPDLDANQMLLDIEAIKQLKARYFRYIDTKQWDDLKALFTADARWNVDGGSGHYEWDDPDEFIAHLVERLGGAGVSVHQGHMPEIELIDAANASGIWAMFDYVDIPTSPRDRATGTTTRPTARSQTAGALPRSNSPAYASTPSTPALNASTEELGGCCPSHRTTGVFRREEALGSDRWQRFPSAIECWIGPRRPSLGAGHWSPRSCPTWPARRRPF